ncbi:putative crossover junction endonuclease EME2, partial [Eschrichtius robustus]|nr:putative crossover junction endonuclease EME2 [Eschrichtius robustus]
ILEDAGADILMEALDALGYEYLVEPERPAWSLRWSRVKPDPCPFSGPPEVRAADEQDRLLLLEPEEFLQGSSTQEIWQPERPAVARAKVAVGWPEVEEALVLLQLWANVDVLLVASWQELSQHVCAFTKALTQRPFKCVYVACGMEQERLALLADLPVKMGEDVQPHRVGPDLSRHICLFLTTTNPNLLLDLGS